MSRLLGETVEVAAPPETIREILHDAAALRRVLPGCEHLTAEGENRYRGVLAIRLGFVTIRADVTATLDDPLQGGPTRLMLSGRPRGLVGSFSAEIPFHLAATERGTTVEYTVDLSVSGRLAAFGAPLLRDATRRQVEELVRNVEREVAP